MFSFKDLSHSHLKRIASYYNKHIKIKGVSKLSKEELINELEKHLFINENGDIKFKDHSKDIIEKNPKTKREELEKLVKFEKKQIEKINNNLSQHTSETVKETKQMLKDSKERF